jgi:outer membrane protein OmpA-like peptidoglycan-associated protein
MTRFTTLIVAATLVLAAGATPLLAQSSSQIEEALKPKVDPNKPVTRSLGGTRSIANDPQAAAERQVLERARTRAISVESVQPAAKEEREQIAAIAKGKPKIDLEIYFDYNSDVIGPKAVGAVNSLGEALSKPGLKGGTFVLNGHTDAAGSPEYNLALSHRRAQSVRRYLIETYKIAPDALLVAGFGKERLKLPEQPLSGENRRVEVVNATQ